MGLPFCRWVGATFHEGRSSGPTTLDREWEDKSLSEVLKAPVSALAGVSEADAEALRRAFNVKTVGDLGRNKFFRAAQAL